LPYRPFLHSILKNRGYNLQHGQSDFPASGLAHCHRLGAI
jgi:hypothetical protein